MSFLLKKEGNRFTKTSRNVQGGIMRPPSDGGLKMGFCVKLHPYLAEKCSDIIKLKIFEN